MAATETTFNSKMLCRFNNKKYTYYRSRLFWNNQIEDSRFDSVVFKGAEVIDDGIKISGTRGQSEGILTNKVGDYSNYTIYLVVSSTDPCILELPNALAITTRNNMYAIDNKTRRLNSFISCVPLINKLTIAIVASNNQYKVFFNGSLQYRGTGNTKLIPGNILFGTSTYQLNSVGDILYYDFAISYEAQSNETVKENSEYLTSLYSQSATIGGGFSTSETPTTSGQDGRDGEDGFSPIVDVHRNNNDNGVTISITDSTGTKTADVLDGTAGAEGAAGSNGTNGTNGQDGFSPVVDVQRNIANNGVTISITDSTGTKTADVLDGAAGAAGANGQDGAAGAAGTNGQDGFSPIVDVQRNVANNGVTISITDSTGTKTADVLDGTAGTNGQDGVSPTVSVQRNTNDNGVTISVTDANGTTTADVLDGAAGTNGTNGQDGATGANGQDGFSPIVSVQRNNADNGVTISVTDANGTTTADVLDGADGAAGSGGGSAVTISANWHTLPTEAASWTNNQYTFTYSHNTSNRTIIDIDTTQLDSWSEYGVYAYSETSEAIIFKCKEVPETALRFKIATMVVQEVED